MKSTDHENSLRRYTKGTWGSYTLGTNSSELGIFRCACLLVLNSGTRYDEEHCVTGSHTELLGFAHCFWLSNGCQMLFPLVLIALVALLVHSVISPLNERASARPAVGDNSHLKSFTITDLTGLFAYWAIILSALSARMRREGRVEDRSDLWLIGGLLCIASSYLWWRSIHLLNRVGVTSSLKRALFATILPVTIAVGLSGEAIFIWGLLDGKPELMAVLLPVALWTTIAYFVCRWIVNDLPYSGQSTENEPPPTDPVP